VLPDAAPVHVGLIVIVIRTSRLFAGPVGQPLLHQAGVEPRHLVRRPAQFAALGQRKLRHMFEGEKFIEDQLHDLGIIRLVAPVTLQRSSRIHS
jgi:hypothetical protein